MKMLLAQFHEKYLLAKPLLSLFFIFLLTAISAWYVQDFKLAQILTLGVVFLAIFLMFTLFFRTLILALIAIVPNLVVGVSVLGLMGGVGISFTDK